VCWSAGSDTVAGVAITAASLIGLTQVRHRNDTALALLPVILGVHQLIESQVWRELSGGQARGGWVVAWMVIALPLLPAYVPLAVIRAEGRREGVRRQLPFVALGLTASAVLAWSMVASSDLHAVRSGASLDYELGGRGVIAAVPVTAAYGIAVIGCMLVTHDQPVRELGIAAGLGLLVTVVLFTTVFASTWCAEAAIVSLQVIRRVRTAPCGTRTTLTWHVVPTHLPRRLVRHAT